MVHDRERRSRTERDEHVMLQCRRGYRVATWRRIWSSARTTTSPSLAMPTGTPSHSSSGGGRTESPSWCRAPKVSGSYLVKTWGAKENDNDLSEIGKQRLCNLLSLVPYFSPNCREHPSANIKSEPTPHGRILVRRLQRNRPIGQQNVQDTSAMLVNGWSE